MSTDESRRAARQRRRAGKGVRSRRSQRAADNFARLTLVGVVVVLACCFSSAMLGLHLGCSYQRHHLGKGRAGEPERNGVGSGNKAESAPCPACGMMESRTGARTQARLTRRLQGIACCLANQGARGRHGKANLVPARLRRNSPVEFLRGLRARNRSFLLTKNLIGIVGLFGRQRRCTATPCRTGI